MSGNRTLLGGYAVDCARRLNDGQPVQSLRQFKVANEQHYTQFKLAQRDIPAAEIQEWAALNMPAGAKVTPTDVLRSDVVRSFLTRVVASATTHEASEREKAVLEQARIGHFVEEGSTETSLQPATAARTAAPAIPASVQLYNNSAPDGQNSQADIQAAGAQPQSRETDVRALLESAHARRVQHEQSQATQLSAAAGNRSRLGQTKREEHPFDAAMKQHREMVPHATQLLAALTRTSPSQQMAVERMLGLRPGAALKSVCLLRKLSETLQNAYSAADN